MPSCFGFGEQVLGVGGVFGTAGRRRGRGVQGQHSGDCVLMVPEWGLDCFPWEMRVLIVCVLCEGGLLDQGRGSPYCDSSLI